MPSLSARVKKVRLESRERNLRVRFNIYQSLRKIVDSRDAIVSPSFEALPLPDLLFHSPTTTPQFFAAMLSCSTRARINTTYIAYIHKYIRVVYPVDLASSSCKKGLLSIKGDGELGLSRSMEKSAFNRSLLRDCPRALLAHERSKREFLAIEFYTKSVK